MLERVNGMLPILGLALLLPVQVMAQASPDEVADRYISLTFDQRYDDLLDLYAEDAVFWDPTGDVFRGSGAAGVLVHGGGAIVETQKSWGIAESEFDLAQSFTVGEYSLYRGILRVRYTGSEDFSPIPLITVIRVEDGRVSERLDIGEYIESFGMGDGFAESTRETEEVAARYLEAYLGADFEAQQALLATDAKFQDPTAQVYGPNSGLLLSGADQIVERRRRTFQNVTNFGLEVSESFVANHHAVFIGTTTYTLANGTRFAQPAVFMVEVRDGRVSRHWDFVDYSVGPVG